LFKKQTLIKVEVIPISSFLNEEEHIKQLIQTFFLFVCSFLVLPLWAETLALYSTCDTDPTTTLEIQPMPCCFDWEEMMQEAQAYAQNDEPLLNYIIAILNDENFQSNPQGYLDAWRKKRGYTREYRIPEDQALSFFAQHFQ